MKRPSRIVRIRSILRSASSFKAGFRCILMLLLAASMTSWGWSQQTESQAENVQKTKQDDKEAKPKRPEIYLADADANQQIAAAVAKAKKENRRVLIQWGANWCGWCHALHDLFKTNPEIRRELMYEYDWILVDVGQLDKNMELVEKYQADIKKEGLPYLTVLDVDGNVVVNQETSSLENKEEGAKGHSPEAVMKFLTQYQAEAVDANATLERGIAAAQREGKLVFLHFGAPWCGWCHYLENWMAEPEVDGMLSPKFVDVKIDIDRMTGGKELLAKFRKSDSGGIPWFLFLNPANDEVVVTSDGPEGNVGFPSTDEEIAYFATMLEKTSLGVANIEKLSSSLVANRQKRESSRPK